MSSVALGSAVKAVPLPSHAGLTRLSLAPKGISGVTASDTCDASMGAAIYGTLARVHISHGLTAARRVPQLQPRFCLLRSIPMFLYYRDGKDSASSPDGALLASAYTLRRATGGGVSTWSDGVHAPFEVGDAVRLLLEPVCGTDDAYELYAPNDDDATAWIAAFASLSHTASSASSAAAGGMNLNSTGGDGGTGSAAHSDAGRGGRRVTEDDVKRAEAAAEMAEVQKVKVARAYTRDLGAIKACAAALAACVQQLKTAASAGAAHVGVSEEVRTVLEGVGEAVAVGVSTSVKELSDSTRVLMEACSAVASTVEGLKARAQRTPVRAYTPTRGSVAAAAVTPLALTPAVPQMEVPPVELPAPAAAAAAVAKRNEPLVASAHMNRARASVTALTRTLSDDATETEEESMQLPPSSATVTSRAGGAARRNVKYTRSSAVARRTFNAGSGASSRTTSVDERTHVKNIKLLTAFFSLYAPHKVDGIHDILTRFRGRESALFALLERTYMRPVEAPMIALPSWPLTPVAEAPPPADTPPQRRYDVGGGVVLELEDDTDESPPNGKLPPSRVKATPRTGVSASFAGTTRSRPHARPHSRASVDHAPVTAHDAVTRVRASVADGRLAAAGSTTKWVPDEASDVCMICGTYVRVWGRTHHCRRCGRIVCSACSPDMAPAPDLGILTPVRQCTDCIAIV